MPKISMFISEKDLAAIDAVAEPNRTAFMVDAARKAVKIQQARRLESDIIACLHETAEDDVALCREFSGTVADGV